MEQVTVINTITVPSGMESIAEKIREEYTTYFSNQVGFVSSTLYQSMSREKDGSIKYVNTVVWESYNDFEKVVNGGFSDENGTNTDGMKVLGKGFPEPIKVSPGQYIVLRHTYA